MEPSEFCPEHFHRALKRSRTQRTVTPHSLLLLPPPATSLGSSLQIPLFWILLIRELCDLGLCISFLQLITLFLRSIQEMACIKTSFFFMAEQHSIVWTDHTVFNHSSVDGHWGSFYLLAIVNSVAMNVWVRVLIFVSVFSSFWSIPRSGIAGL